MSQINLIQINSSAFALELPEEIQERICRNRDSYVINWHEDLGFVINEYVDSTSRLSGMENLRIKSPEPQGPRALKTAEEYKRIFNSIQTDTLKSITLKDFGLKPEEFDSKIFMMLQEISQLHGNWKQALIRKISPSRSMWVDSIVPDNFDHWWQNATNDQKCFMFSVPKSSGGLVKAITPQTFGLKERPDNFDFLISGIPLFRDEVPSWNL